MGFEKASAPFGEKSLLEFVVARLAPPGTPVLVSLRPGAPPPPVGEPVYDAVADEGPLAGVAALLAAAATKFVLVAACDAPFLPPDLGDRLLARSKGVDAVLIERDGRVEPFPALVACERAPILRELMATGARRADAWHERTAAAYVPFGALFPGEDAATCFANVNDPEALAAARRRIAEAGGAR
jgi:molybdopterin-guanine dinucleotide biosynthesis protein A